MFEGPVLDLVVVVMGLLFAASVAAIVCSRIQFPFTILLVLVGLLLGWGSQNHPLLQPLARFSLSPDIVFFIFLPVLIFESAYNLNCRALLKNLAPILTLAIPGLVISTATVGFLMHFLLSLPLGVSLLFGALISATDPVAVVSLFREIGAPKRLGLLVEGESLFNDGTALVLFRVILGVVLAGQFGRATVAEGFLEFLFVFTGGVMVGIALGLVFSKIIELVENDPLVEITLSWILANAAFMSAEHFLHVSGVMAVVAAGLTLGTYGRTKISPPVMPSMRSIWEYAAFLCNSLIFLLVGLSIDPALLLENHVAILYGALAVLAARGLVVYSLFPLVFPQGSREGISRSFQTVIFWGGLKGALAIVMALSLPEELEQKSFILALTLGVVLISLLLNGLTIRPLIRLVGLDKYSLKESYQRSQAMLAAMKHALAELEPLRQRAEIQNSVLRAETAAYQKDIASLSSDLEDFTRTQRRFKKEDETEIILRQCLSVEKLEYRNLFDEGMLREDNLKELDHLLDNQLDWLKEGKMVSDGQEQFSLFNRVEGALLQATGSWSLVKPLVSRFKAERIAAGYELGRARFIVSGVLLARIQAMEEQATVSSEAIQAARKRYRDLHRSSQGEMATIRSGFPEYVEKVEKRILRRFFLSAEMGVFRELYLEGAISEKVWAEMEEQIGRRVRAMKMRPVEELLISPLRLMRMIPYFRELDDTELSSLTSRLSALSFLPGEEIVREGDPGDSLFVIGRGEVEVLREEEGERRHLAVLKAGEFFGEIALLQPQPRTATVMAVTPCTLLELTQERLLPHLANAPRLQAALEKALRERTAPSTAKQG